MTQGTVPDLMQKVENGIGGFYEFEYANSTGFDNTGGDGISDLPMNYKVCVKQTINDGVGGIAYNKYEYKGGYAFSAFIAAPFGSAQATGKKETDYFGFSEFRVIDPLGSKTINLYNTVPYTAQIDGADYFLKNRVLAGAIKESRFIGWDAKEYSKTQYTYNVERLSASGTATSQSSYLVYPSKTTKYVQGTKTETNTTTTRNAIEIGVDGTPTISGRKVTREYAARLST